jgi:hypothetical protein
MMNICRGESRRNTSTIFSALWMSLGTDASMVNNVENFQRMSA